MINLNLEYIKESVWHIKEKSEKAKNNELINCIIETKNMLLNANQNYDFAQGKMIDYFLYQIKANEAKLDFLMNEAKNRRIELDLIEAAYYKQDKVV